MAGVLLPFPLRCLTTGERCLAQCVIQNTSEIKGVFCALPCQGGLLDRGLAQALTANHVPEGGAIPKPTRVLLESRPSRIATTSVNDRERSRRAGGLPPVDGTPRQAGRGLTQELDKDRFAVGILIPIIHVPKIDALHDKLGNP